MSELLTDRDAVLRHMQEAVPADVDGDEIDELIAEASDSIPRYCNREFVPTNAYKRRFEFRPGKIGRSVRIDLRPFELRTASVVKLDPEIAEGTVLTSAQYRLYPEPSRDGTYFGLRLAAGTLPPQPSAALEYPIRYIDIEGDWGMAEVPDAVRRLAKMTVAEWLRTRRNGGMVGDRQGEEEVPMLRANDLPPAVRWALRANWNRPLMPR